MSLKVDWKVLVKYLVSAVVVIALSLWIYSEIVAFFSIDSVKISTYDELLDYQFRQKYLTPWYAKLPIYKLFAQSDLVINTIYSLIYLMFATHMWFTIFGKFDKKVVESVISFTTYSALTLGTIGTMYAIAVATHGGGNGSMSEIVQKAFYDAIYTTLMGLSISLLNMGMNVIYTYRNRGV